MNLDTKIPPPVVTLIILTIIYFFEIKEYELNNKLISITIFSIGLVFIFSAVFQFLRIKPQ